MIEKDLSLGIGARGNPGKTLLVKNTNALDTATLRDSFGYAQDQFNGDVLMFADLSSAISACRDGLGDTILVSPGYTETISTVAGVEIDKSITIKGLGVGNNRPKLTFDSVVGASLLVSGDNVRIENVIGIAGLDSLTNPFHIIGDGFSCDIEWQDGSNAVEALRAMRLDTANNADVKLVYHGFADGGVVVNAIAVDDCDNVKIDIDAFGTVTNAWVEFVDAASNNVSVVGRMYTDGVTDYSKNVVDTVTGSSWDVDVFDSSYGGRVNGGSASAIAPSSGSTGTPIGASLAADVQAFAGLAFRAKADSTAAGGLDQIEISELSGFGDDYFNDKYFLYCIKNANDVGNAPEGEMHRISNYVSTTGTFTVQGGGFGSNLEADDEFLVIHESVAMLGFNSDDNEFDSSSVVPNEDGSLMERVEFLQSRVGRVVSKNYADMTGFDGGTAFTVTGDVLVRCFGVVGNTAITSTSGTTTLSVGAGELPDILIASTTIDNSDFAATDVWVNNDPAYDAQNLSDGLGWTIIGGGADITITRNVDDITGGNLTLYVEWKPLSANGNVVAV